MRKITELGNHIIQDAVYDTRMAGVLMGGLHPNQVNGLIRDGRIQGLLRAVRGSQRGRTVVMGSEIVKFNQSLPIKPAGENAAPNTSPTMPTTRRPPRLRSLQGIEKW